MRVDSSNDPEVREVGQLSVDSFARAAQLMNPAPQRVSFPYEDTTLAGWWIPADLGTAHPTGGDPDGPRPTLPKSISPAPDLQRPPGRTAGGTGASSARTDPDHLDGTSLTM